MALARGGLAPAFRVSAATGFSLPMEIALVGLTLVVLFVLVYPTAWIMIASFKSPAAIFRSSTGTAFSQGRTSRGRIGENGRVSIGVAFPVVRR